MTSSPNRPTLLNGCASAATAQEAAFRIDAGPRIPRATRVITLDERASDLVQPLADPTLSGVRYLRYESAGAPADAPDDLLLATLDNSSTRLMAELEDADFVLMVATDASGTAAASAIGAACVARGMVTAGVVLGGPAARRGRPDSTGDAAVTALRPFARTLLVSDDRFDVVEVLQTVGS